MMLTRFWPALYNSRQHSWNLTRNIYRFVPATIDQVKGFHTINEACVVPAHAGSMTLSADSGCHRSHMISVAQGAFRCSFERDPVLLQADPEHRGMDLRLENAGYRDGMDSRLCCPLFVG